ncbi:SpoIID/LytB domain-containing protein [Methylomusa anaerophila]|uniref:Amidase enhancer n=1 Tax=Methylomusa anaerophila TaxID=1930071 RepID=A0A348AP65_9FIRM|nr:SpoIID/LytB domain-containing protein [Methylomusa anaerophila]BBB92863.1 amidase enhancer precursor [Methylomusa anaerophila]
MLPRKIARKIMGSISVFLLIVLFGAQFPCQAKLEYDSSNTLKKTYEPSIKIGIAVNQSSVIISANTDFELAAASETGMKPTLILGKFRSKDRVVLTAKNGYVALNNKQMPVQSLAVILRHPNGIRSSEDSIEVSERHYRGSIEVRATGGNNGLTVINTVPVEQYLYGVIKNEISPDWPIEAVKAQAVAARTYAMANLNKHKADGFDVCTTTDCQIYGGRESEAFRAIEAVDSTRGLVLTYDGKLITAYFHSSSGGYTENSENVWSAYLPYLRGVVDTDQYSPYYKWDKSIPLHEVNAMLGKAGYKVGSLQAIELTPLSKPPVNVADRGISGRVKTLRLIGANGEVYITGAKFRSLFGLNSTLFDINFASAGQMAATDKTDAFKYRNTKVGNTSSTKNISSHNNIRYVINKKGSLVISGFGWGHGLGLSQWGAKAMADKAQGNPEYFKDILKHYYQGVEIIKLY